MSVEKSENAQVKHIFVRTLAACLAIVSYLLSLRIVHAYGRATYWPLFGSSRSPGTSITIAVAYSPARTFTAETIYTLLLRRVLLSGPMSRLLYLVSCVHSQVQVGF